MADVQQNIARTGTQRFHQFQVGLGILAANTRRALCGDNLPLTADADRALDMAAQEFTPYTAEWFAAMELEAYR